MPAVASESAEHGGEHGEEHHKNILGAFIGLTHERRESGLALGIEYERKLSESLGIAVMAERTWGDLDFWVVATPVYVAVDRWHFGIGPGVEVTEDETFGLVRLLLGYEYEGEHLNYAPAFAVDFVDGEQVYILGIAVGFGF